MATRAQLLEALARFNDRYERCHMELSSEMQISETQAQAVPLPRDYQQELLSHVQQIRRNPRHIQTISNQYSQPTDKARMR